MMNAIFVCLLGFVFLAKCEINIGLGACSAVNLDVEYHEAVKAYWTTERMETAIPMVKYLDNEGDDVVVNDTACKKGTNVPKVGSFYVDKPLTYEPFKQIGKVFFSIGKNNYVCSGSSVGGGVVLTAGHCVGEAGTYYTNWIFMPQYKSGVNPSIGSFTANSLCALTQWMQNGDFARDVAFAVVSSTLEDKVGKLHLTFDIETSCYWAPTGYPAASPWTGQLMAQTYNIQSLTDRSMTPNTRGVSSTLNGGCSGGPWIYNIDIADPSQEGFNFAGGLNSYLYTNAFNIYSPTFDGVVKSFFDQVTMLDSKIAGMKRF